jgi:hypothetical protein
MCGFYKYPKQNSLHTTKSYVIFWALFENKYLELLTYFIYKL